MGGNYNRISIEGPFDDVEDPSRYDFVFFLNTFLTSSLAAVWCHIFNRILS